VIVFAALVLAQIAAPYPPTGKLVDAGGYRVHLNCTGEGNPTVIVTGAGFSFDWILVQPEVAKFTRVCTYDPAGTAWSDPGPGPDCADRVAEIHKVLDNAGFRGPYVLVGLSIGALVARLYAAEYPQDVAGVVIVDHAFLNPVDPSPPIAISAPGLDSPPILIHQEPIVLTTEDISLFNHLPARDRELHWWAESLHPVHPTVETAEACTTEVEKLPNPLTNLPLIVVSTGNDSHNYLALQAKLLALSHNSRQLIAEKSFHAVEIDQPEVVVTAIRQVVETVRK
jgi:pimeloyl-ACP methyl ester carboxylesterase